MKSLKCVPPLPSVKGGEGGVPDNSNKPLSVENKTKTTQTKNVLKYDFFVCNSKELPMSILDK